MNEYAVSEKCMWKVVLIAMVFRMMLKVNTFSSNKLDLP